jgi:protein gp37
VEKIKMGERTSITWTDATFNPWWGCTHISPACDHCYAETFAIFKGYKDLWSPYSHARRFFGEAHWDEPISWNRKAAKDGKIFRVFCGSMCDLFEVPENDFELACIMNGERDRLWNLILKTPKLEWILLTKRPENIQGLIYYEWNNPATLPKNVRVMATVENQEMADKRIPILLKNWSGKNGISVEPMLGPVNLNSRRIDWVICGGESGKNARPLQPDWIRSLRDQCAESGTPFHFKQWGEWYPYHPEAINLQNRDEKYIEGIHYYHLGKKLSGCYLDGVEYKEFPEDGEK